MARTSMSLSRESCRAPDVVGESGTKAKAPARRPGGLSAIPAGLLVLFLGLPIVGLLGRALGAGTVLAALGRPIVLEALRLSMLSTLAVLLLSLVLGSPLALLLARRRFRGIG